MYITNGRVFGGGGGGTPNILIFWLFLDSLSISEQTINRALTIHTELQNYDSMKKIFRKIISLIFTTYQNYPLALTDFIYVVLESFHGEERYEHKFLVTQHTLS